MNIIPGIVIIGVMVASFSTVYFFSREDAPVKDAPVKPEMVMMHWEYGSDVVGHYSTESQIIKAKTCSYINDSPLVWESESGSYTRIFCEPILGVDLY